MEDDLGYDKALIDEIDMRDPASIEAIAVVDLSFRLTGGANDIEGLWKLLESGDSSWQSVPIDRYNEAAFYHPNEGDPNGTNNHPGGHFISEDIRDFDHAFFRSSKAQAAATDPQQRLIMELTYEALESGGITCESLASTATSVYTASFTADYERQLDKDPLDVPAYYATGTGRALLSNRISHMLDLRGPSMTIDTACSGGLIGLHQACQDLRSGESKAAIVAAVNLIMGPDQAIGLSNLRMISSTGRSYPFDNRGEGYGRGEGAVVLVLKRLDDAIRDRDNVRTVIRASAAGQDGFTPQNITYPIGPAQAALIQSTYARCGLRPEDTPYVEAHGTGTVAGDTEELSGISEAFVGSSYTGRPQSLYVGSMKGAIGHTECVSGLASLLKAIAMFEHEMIPPVAGFANPKPGLPLDRISIPTKAIPWPQTPGLAPRISINSFGFGGANAHVILERHAPGPAPNQEAGVASSLLFTFSANCTTSLASMVEAHVDWVSQWRKDSFPLVDLSYTLVHRRTALPYRFSAVAHDQTSLPDQLHRNSERVANKMPPKDTDIFFIFTGQGAQWAGMGRELLLETTTPSSTFRDSIRISGHIIHSLGATWDLETELIRSSPHSRLGEAELAQPATTAIQIALVALLRAQGVRPRAVVGHSSGEIAAAYASGYISHETAISLAYHRGFMASLVKAKGISCGAMLSVGLGAEEVTTRFLRNLFRGQAVVACINSPRSVTVSGDLDAVEEVIERIAAAGDGIFHRKLLVDTAYHSHHMRAVADEYRGRISDAAQRMMLENAGNEVAFVSSVTGKPKQSNFDADYWVSNLTSTVNFAEAVHTLGNTHCRSAGVKSLFIEIGPHPSLSGAVRQSKIFQNQNADTPTLSMEYLAPLQREMDAVSSMLSLAGKLFENGVSLTWDAVSTLSHGLGTATVRHDFPAYTWDHSVKHWHQSRVARAYLHRKEPYHDLVGVPVPDATDIEPRWRHFISLATLPWLADHVVDSLIVFPGSGYLCMAIEGSMQLSRLRYPKSPLETVVLRDVSFKRALIVPETQRVDLQLSLRPLPGSEFCFHFTIAATSDDEKWYEHAVGVIEGLWAEDKLREQAESTPLEQVPTIHCSLGTEHILHDNLYRQLDAVGNTYGPAFAGLSSITMAADAAQAVSSLKVQDVRASMPSSYQQPHVVHPSTLDTILHTSLPLAGRRLGAGSIMPVQIGELLVNLTPLLQKPGSTLDISTQIVSTQYRTAFSEVTVVADGRRVLSATGIELRSLAARQSETQNQAPTTNPRDICYQLGWHADIEHLRAEDLAENASLADIITHVCVKRHKLSIIGLGVNVDLTEQLLKVVQNHDDNVEAEYDFVDATPARFEDAAARINNFPMRFRMLRPGMRPGPRGFKTSSYDLVLAASARWLEIAAELVKPGGIIMVVMDAAIADGKEWRRSLQRTHVDLEEQTAILQSHGKFVLLAKARPSKLHLPQKIHILTHSCPASSPAWVTSVCEGLRVRGAEVTLDKLSPENLQPLLSSGGKDNTAAAERKSKVFIVMDDEESPILSDAYAFPAAMTLFTSSIQVVWLSPDDLPAFHQIEGVARTAHAENGSLRMTTVHSDTGVLINEEKHSRLVDIVASVCSSLANPNMAHAEREYRVRESGLVVVPRLHHADGLNQAISGSDASIVGPEREIIQFANCPRTLRLSPDDSGLFIVDEQVHNSDIADEEIEIETAAFSYSNSGGKPSLFLGEYTGIVARVGPSVTSVAPRDRVIALGPAFGVSRLRIRQSQALRVDPEIQATQIPANTRVALLLDVIAATYAVRNVARVLSSKGTILVHGAHTAAGRAVIAVSRSMGIRVTATAGSAAEVGLLKAQLGLDGADLLVTRPSLDRLLARQVFPEGLDAIIRTGEGCLKLLTDAIGLVKPFGSVVTIGDFPLVSTTTATIPRLPPNVAIHSIDIISLLNTRPDMVASLMASYTTALKHFPLSGLDIPVLDVADSETALRLVNTGVHQKVVLEGVPSSRVQILRSLANTARVMQLSDTRGTYVVAGGLGDIGQRLFRLLAERGAHHVATISRRALGSEALCKLQENLKAIQPSFQLYTLQGDITSTSSMQDAAAELASNGAPPVCGIIQAAIVLIERPLELVTFQDFSIVTKPKVQGTENLLSAFQSPKLGFMLCLSSFAGINGVGALGAYNAGNTVQDFLAHAGACATPAIRHEASTRFVTVNFGWTDDVMYTANDDKRKSALRRAGFTPIRAKELERFFRYVLCDLEGASPSHQLRQAIIGVDADSLAGTTASNSNVHAAMFSHIRDTRQKVEGGAAGSGVDDSGVVETDKRTFEQIVGDGDVVAVVEFVSRAVSAQLARLIDVNGATINVRRGSILALGLDSLVAVELRNWIMKHFQAPLQSSEILVEQTVWALSERIVARSTGLSITSVSDAPPSVALLEKAPVTQASQNDNFSVNFSDPAPSFEMHDALDRDFVLGAFQAARDATDGYISNGNLNTYSAEWMPKSDEVAIAIFCNALEELGCPIRSSGPGSELARIQHLAAHEKLVCYMYQSLEKRDLVRVVDGCIIRTEVPCPSDDVDTLIDRLLSERPGQEAEVELMRLMGTNYGRCLAGKADAVQLLFGDPHTRKLLARSYSSSELNSVLLKQLIDFLESVARSWTEKKTPLRILEVGAGTGGTTAWLLPMLARLNIPVIYTVTDVGPVFVKDLSSKFKQVPFVVCKVLDIEHQPEHALRGTQHIVLGTNVIHATRDVSQSLENIHALLRPDGFVVIGEMTTQMLWTDVIFGLLTGFWCFEDGRQHATQGTKEWKLSLRSAGYGHVDSTQGQRPEAALQALIFALTS